MKRQGDVLLVPATYVQQTHPERFTALVNDRTPIPVDSHDPRVILAHGEVTGHAHAIEEAQRVQHFESCGETFLEVVQSTSLRHEEHAEIPLEADMAFLVTIQTEYTPEAIRRVLD